MATSFLIMLREGFEAALVVAILYAYLVRSGRGHLRPALWRGVGLAVAVSVVAGWVLHTSIDGLEGTARLLAFAGVSVAAVVVLTWMVLWMRSHAHSLRGELQSRLDEAMGSKERVGFAVGLAAFVAVLREALEAVLFLVAISTSASGAQVFAGAAAGLALAGTLGWLVVLGGLRIPMKRFFQVTGMVLVVFAAGLLARAVGLLQSAEVLGTVNGAVYDVTAVRGLTTSTESGRFLAALLGWDPRPSLEQVIAWAGYTAVVSWAFLRPYRPPAKPVASEVKPTADASPR
jgi:high-affinity iron transporter